MKKVDAAEADRLIRKAMGVLLEAISSRGREGAQLRTAIGDLFAHLESYLLSDTVGRPLDSCFEQARLAGASLTVLEQLRLALSGEKPRTLGGQLIKDTLIQFSLTTEARTIIDIKFTNRQAVDDMIQKVNAAFAPAEEDMADAMDAATYRDLIELHAATTRYLTEASRPLPRMIRFRFATPLSTLYASHRLYDTAGRADEIRAENDVVHPAFMQPTGRALSS